MEILTKYQEQRAYINSLYSLTSGNFLGEVYASLPGALPTIGENSVINGNILHRPQSSPRPRPGRSWLVNELKNNLNYTSTSISTDLITDNNMQPKWLVEHNYDYFIHGTAI